MLGSVIGRLWENGYLQTGWASGWLFVVDIVVTANATLQPLLWLLLLLLFEKIPPIAPSVWRKINLFSVKYISIVIFVLLIVLYIVRCMWAGRVLCAASYGMPMKYVERC